jgi:hypothetical protein
MNMDVEVGTWTPIALKYTLQWHQEHTVAERIGAPGTLPDPERRLSSTLA